MKLLTGILPWGLALLGLSACEDLNSGWSVDGGGYMKIYINGEGPKTLDIDVDDGNVDLDYDQHWVSFLGKDASEGDYLQVLVYKPALGKNTPQTSVNYTYLVLGNSTRAKIIDAESSYVQFDQKDDSLWSANLRLVFNHCYADECDTSRVVITGRMRYWVDPDD